MLHWSIRRLDAVRGVAFALCVSSALWALGTLCAGWLEAGRLSAGTLTVLVAWSICIVQIRSVVRASDPGVTRLGVAPAHARSIGAVHAARGAVGRAFDQLRGVYQTPSESPAASAAPSPRA